MRQRNDSGQTLTVHTDPPQVVEPGEVIDHDTHIVGLTAVDEPAPADKPATDSQPAKPARATSKEATR